MQRCEASSANDEWGYPELEQRMAWPGSLQEIHQTGGGSVSVLPPHGLSSCETVCKGLLAVVGEQHEETLKVARAQT